MKHFLKISLFFLLILYLVLLNASVSLDEVLKNDPTKKFNWIYSRENGVYDFAVIGSSRGACNVDVYTLEAELGQKGINLSQVGTAFPELKLILEAFLKKNQIKRLLVEVDIFGLDNSNFGHPYHEYNYFPYINEDFIYSDMKNNFGTKAVVWKYVPFYKYAEFNSISGISGVISILKKQPSEYDEKGGMMLDTPFLENSAVMENRNKIKNSGYKIDKERVDALNSILAIAKEKGIPVVMFIAPSLKEALQYQLNRVEIAAFYSDLAKETGNAFLDFTNEPMSNDINLFADLEHTTRKGAIEFSKILAGRIK